MRCWISFVLLVGMAAVADPQEPRSEAIQRLAHTKVFAFGGVGFAGVISQGEKDFHFILKQPSASRDFEALFETGTPEAKGYALVAIRELNKAHFKSLLDGLENSKERAHTMEGCIGGERSLVGLAKEIDSGRYDAWLTNWERTH